MSEEDFQASVAVQVAAGDPPLVMNEISRCLEFQWAVWGEFILKQCSSNMAPAKTSLRGRRTHDALQDEDVGISESVQSGLHSST